MKLKKLTILGKWQYTMLLAIQYIDSYYNYRQIFDKLRLVNISLK